MSSKRIIDSYLHIPDEPKHRITISYAIVTPESSKQGDYSETGWEDKEGISMEPDEWEIGEGITPVDKAIAYLQDVGARSSGGPWYEMTATDVQTGDDTTYSYHLNGFTPQEEIEIKKEVR